MPRSVTAKRRVLGDNPFGVEPGLDLLHAVPVDAPGWSETMYFHAWSPQHRIGVFVHTGPWPADLDLWWAQVIAMLPDGELLVDRSWGRAVDARGPATRNLRVTCTTPLRGWRLAFDGAGAVCDLATMAAGPVGAGPARAFSFDLELQAVAPVWDMHGALGIDGLSWASFHHTQGFRATGRLTVGSRRWDVDGVAHRDHSSGPRDIGGLGGLHFFVVVFLRIGRVVNGLVNWRRDGQVDHRTFCIQQAGVIASRARIVAAADDARRRLERDLHDGAQQRLVSLGLQLRAAEASVPPELHSLKEQISAVVTGLVGVSGRDTVAAALWWTGVFALAGPDCGGDATGGHVDFSVHCL